jgi:para-aminobenzoate synthetase/4-amino-4-deoxychorismate lyase
MLPAAPSLRFDFPDPGGEGGPLLFERPGETIEAHAPAEVRKALARADACARDGKWVAGFVCYEAAAAFDSAFRFRGRSALPLAWFGVFDAPARAAAEAPGATQPSLAWTPTTSRSRYDADIAAIHAHIRAGDVYQVNHTLRLGGRFVGDSRALYQRLRARQPDGYCAYIELGRHRILSLSPELFFRRAGERLTLKPMKGTARRGDTTAADRALADALRASEKDRAENLMIVDLIRNDLSRIARPRSVAVPALFAVEAHPTVWQMTSTVAADLREEVDLERIFAALFPCGSITGAPKIKAMEIIARREEEARGIYCGAIGVIRPGGDAIFNVAIRTVALDAVSGEGRYGVGGGITADSIAGREYDEVLAKCLVIGEHARPVFAGGAAMAA